MSGWAQLRYLRADVDWLVRGRAPRLVFVPFTTTFAIVATYRVERCLYLWMGPAYRVVRALLGPLLFVTGPWRSNCEIPHWAEIGPGLRIAHPELGIVVSGHIIAGKRLFLTGGNCIGMRDKPGPARIVLGDDCVLGANATVLGPVVLGDGVVVGAGSVVVNDYAGPGTLVGAPARPVPSDASSSSSGAATGNLT